ncbi:MAG: hypothetical protein RIC55_30540 [Pirellulaceae bacterium]
MNDFPFGFEQPDPTTWFYLSSLLTIGLYFKFSSLWRVRNIDLLLLLLLGPGLLLQDCGHKMQQAAQRLLVAEAAISTVQDAPLVDLPGEGGAISAPESDDAGGQSPNDSGDGANAGDAERFGPLDVGGNSALGGEPDAADRALDAAAAATSPQTANVSESATADASIESTSMVQRQRGRFLEMMGFIWLLGVGALLMTRMLLDPMMVRRPLLEPNLSSGGLIFIGCSLFILLIAIIVSGTPTPEDLTGAQGADKIIAGEAPNEEDDSLRRHGPGYPTLHVLPNLATRVFVAGDEQVPATRKQQVANVLTAKAMAVLSQLAIVAGIVLIGFRHFDNAKMGIGAAALYLMLPYTAELTGHVSHLLLAALLVWAVLCYRRPLTAGMFLGLAMGVAYYPFFLLPLWLSFYWQRGLMRFSIGVGAMLSLTVLSLVFQSSDVFDFWFKFKQIFGLWFAKMDGLQGVWGLGWDPVWRPPVFLMCFFLSASFALWPAQKNLGTLLSCSAALMLAMQFWHGFGGGLFIAWYLPLALLTVFRPNLEDRVALTVLGEGWFPRRRRRSDARAFDGKSHERAA